MKKTFSFILLTAVLVLSGTAQTQGSGVLKTASTPTVVNDVLHYYLNKLYFKTGNTDVKTYPSFKTDATGVSTSTAITYCCSKFEVPAGETVTVTGLEGYAKKNTGTAAPSVPIRFYIFSLEPTTGMPHMPAIDSVLTVLSSTSAVLLGGPFTNTATLSQRIMTTSFAVGLRNMSGNNGDFAYYLRTAGATQTNAAAPTSEKYGEGNGFVRYNGKFYSTTNFTMVPDFGVGTDYEFMVAPRVTYELQSSQILPQGVISATDAVSQPDTLCTRTSLTFTNTSSAFYEHRQYNLNQFYRKWNLYSAFPPNVTSAFANDSSVTWHFEFYDNVPPHTDSRVFLPYANNETINAITDYAMPGDCFTANQFRTRLKPMDAFGAGAQIIYNEDFKVCFKYCYDDAVGIPTQTGYRSLNLFPNPAQGGKTLVSGLQGKNTIAVYDLLGQRVFNTVTESDTYELNLSRQPVGTYVVRIVGSENQVKVVKIVNEN